MKILWNILLWLNWVALPVCYMLYTQTKNIYISLIPFLITTPIAIIALKKTENF